MFEKGGYELSRENVRIVLLTTWFVKGLRAKAVYLFCTVLLFFSGLVEVRHPLAYRRAKRLADLAANKMTVEVHGTKFRPLDFLSIPIVGPLFEEWAWSYLSVKKGDVFIDVGAHIGKYACVIARLVGEQGRVIAIEPHPGNYRALVRNLELNGLRNVVALNFAAYNRDCVVNLFEGANSLGRSSIKLDDGAGFVEVQARALDRVPEVANQSRIDLIKIDVEGAEYEVAEGLAGILRAHKPKLLLEVWDFGKLRPLLVELGYGAITLDPHRRGYYFVSP